MTMTTIKVSTQLRDRINHDARQRGVTAASLIEELLDAHERSQRMAAFGRAFRGADATYWDELRTWEATADDGPRGG